MGRNRKDRERGKPSLKRPRINGKRSRVWYVCWSDDEGSHRVSTREDDEEIVRGRIAPGPRARQFFAEYMAARTVAKGSAAHTLEAMADAYYEDRKKKPVRYPKTIAQRLKPIRAKFGLLAPTSLSYELIDEFIDERRKDGVSDATIDAELRALRQVLKFAKKRRWIADVPDVHTPGGNKPRNRFLSDAEVKRLVEALDHPDTAPHIKTFVMLALYTAQRGGAIRELKWDNIDFERGIVWAAPARSRLKNRVSVPMTAGLHAHLRAVREFADTEWVIEWQRAPVSNVKTGFKALLKRADLSNVTVHDLRRTAASIALRRGSSFAEVAALLGDDESVVRRHYAQFEPEYLANTVARIAGPSGIMPEPSDAE